MNGPFVALGIINHLLTTEIVYKVNSAFPGISIKTLIENMIRRSFFESKEGILGLRFKRIRQ